LSRLAIINIGKLVSGDLTTGIIGADSLICENGVIGRIGIGLNVSNVDVIVDAQGTTVIPGLIDSHCHVVLGDYTPRQKTVDFLDSYVHGGITSVISAGEIHAPGRPKDAAGVKALAIAARACFLNFRPTGMKVHGGTIVIEPTLLEKDFKEVAEQGVELAKYGFGAFRDPYEGEPQIRWAQKYGIKVMSHSGGASIPGSKPISAEHLISLKVDICGHVNGGPTALADEGVQRLIRDSDMYLQVVQAGNLSKTLDIIRSAMDSRQLHRIIIGSDTPTGTGVMPLGVIKTVCEISSLTGLAPEKCLALSTGNNARAFNLRCGMIEEGREADLLVLDAPLGSVAADAPGAIARGDIPGISAVIIDGKVRTLSSRNTPKATRVAQVHPSMEWLFRNH
jgi:enamidase